VGAALLAADGRVFAGCNVENASYGLTICAERVALTRAVADGARQFAALALVAGTDQPATPCGACLQVLVEFCPPDMPVYFDTLAGGRVRTLPLRDFLPHAFRLAPQDPRPSDGPTPAAEA
jgi:cytidine deaminase